MRARLAACRFRQRDARGSGSEARLDQARQGGGRRALLQRARQPRLRRGGRARAACRLAAARGIVSQQAARRGGLRGGRRRLDGGRVLLAPVPLQAVQRGVQRGAGARGRLQPGAQLAGRPARHRTA